MSLESDEKIREKNRRAYANYEFKKPEYEDVDRDNLSEKQQEIFFVKVSNSSNTKNEKIEQKEDKTKSVTTYKYSGNGKHSLHESIILNGSPYFVTYDLEGEQVTIKSQFEEPTRIIKPPSLDECPFPAYEFENKEELDSCFKRAGEIESIEELYHKCENFWQLFVDQDKHIMTILIADSILTYFQDCFPITHYTEAIGTNDVGKTSAGYTFEYTGYRVVRAASISGPNYFRIFGTVEPGQCVIIEDEADNISEDPNKIVVLKVGYEQTAKIPKTNMNVKNQDMNWFYPYGYKMLLAEKSIREWQAKGLVDRTFTMNFRPGKAKYPVKEVVSPTISKPEQYKKLCESLLDYRKLLLCYRLLHYRDPLPRLKINLENRDKELSYPLLTLFYGTSVYEEIKEALEYFINQRHERKARSLEAALYPILERLLKPNTDNESVVNFVSIMFSEIWEEITTKNAIPGHNNIQKPTVYHTNDFGDLYRSTLSSIICDVFGAEAKHMTNGSRLTFDLRQFALYRDRFVQKEKDEGVRIEVSLNDGNDDYDGNDGIPEV